MACNCSCSYNNLPCCCPTGQTTICPTTVCPDAQPCFKEVDSQCIIYNGDDYECAGITTGMTVAEVVDIIITSLNLNCTTTTTTTSTTSTTTTSTTTSSTTTSTTSTTTTTTVKPGINECYPIELEVSCNCTYQTFDTSSYSSSIFPPVPGCSPSGYLGNNIWFTFTVPPSGEVIISTSALQITDGVFSVYSGPCVNITEIVCVDDAQGITMPETYLTGLTPGDDLLIRFWGYGGYVTGQVGTFEICVSDPSCCTPVGITGSASACETTTTTSTTTTSTTSTTTTSTTSSTTTSTTSTTSTTTTTTCPCNNYLFVGSSPVVAFTFVECGGVEETSIGLGDKQSEIYCVDNSYPIFMSGDGSYGIDGDPNDCCGAP